MSIRSTSEQNEYLSLTIYNNDMALINEIRSIPKIKDTKENIIVEYYDISKLLIENSVMILGGEVLEINFNYKDSKAYEDISTNYNLENSFISSMDITFESLTSQNIQAYYLTNGITWSGSYEVILDDEYLMLQGWLNIKNTSGLSYNSAIINCVAGNINKVNGQVPILLKSPEINSGDTFNVTKSSLEDYYVYTLKDKNNLKNNTSKRVKFFSSEDISYKKYYNFSYNSTNASIIIEFFNTEENNLGIELPRGIINVYVTNKGNLELIGNANIDNVPRNKKVSLNIGESFDVTSEKKILEFREFDNYEYRKIQLIINNGRDEKIYSNICYPIYGPWEIISSSEPYTKDNNGYPCFHLNLLENEKRILNFDYKVKR